MKISLCIIVKDEEAVLARCLGSVRPYVDEIVAVDTGSADGTVKIAKRYADTVVSFPWNDDFSAARNVSFSHAAGDYLLWMDADDVLPRAEADKFPALRALLDADRPDAVMCPYETGGAVFFRERFLRREANFVWEGRVHECIPLHGAIARSDMKFLHLRHGEPHGKRNLAIYRKWAKEQPLSGRDLFYFGRELYENGEYAEAAETLSRMLAGEGWYVNKIEACNTLAACLSAMGRRGEAMRALYRSFEYGAPRAFVLCALGNLSKEDKRYSDAVFWYRAALLADDHAAEGDFERPDCRLLTPLLELVVCYWRLGRTEEALLCHKKTEEIAPSHPSVLHNRQFFGK